jgi:hypothetical protein
MLFLIVLGLAAGGLWLTRRAVRRFAEQQRRLGRWDAEGPLVETEGPPGGTRGMNERLEVIGEWHGAILRDRRSESEPTSHADRPDHSAPPTQP